MSTSERLLDGEVPVVEIGLDLEGAEVSESVLD